VQVQHRGGNALYINDGVYGAWLTRAHCASATRCARSAPSNELGGFKFLGPTCDSADVMHGPFHLPADATEGDKIEIGQFGAYSGCLRSSFNGFDQARLVEVRDRPLLPQEPQRYSEQSEVHDVAEDESLRHDAVVRR
jgi:ornithine decarboxylase